MVRRGCVRHEGPAPRTPEERAALDTQLEQTLAAGRRGPQTVPGHEVDEVLLVAGWFRKYPKELERTAPFDRDAIRPASKPHIS